MLLIDQLMWIVTPGKEDKSNTYTFYKRAKEQSTSDGHYNRIIFFFFVLKQTHTKKIVCFVSFKVLHQILFFFSMLETMVFLSLVL